MQCESQAPLGLLEEDGLARPGVYVNELNILIGEHGAGQVDGTVECADHHPVLACDEARGLPRAAVVGAGLNWSGRVKLSAEKFFEELVRSVVVGADSARAKSSGIRQLSGNGNILYSIYKGELKTDPNGLFN